MSKNVKVNETSYKGVSIVELPLLDGSGKAQFRDIDEITTGGATENITSGEVTVDKPVATGNYTIAHGLGKIPDIVYVEAVEFEEQEPSSSNLMIEAIKVKDIFGTRKPSSTNLATKTNYSISSTPSYGLIAVDETNIIFKCSSSVIFSEEYTYKWYAISLS